MKNELTGLLAPAQEGVFCAFCTEIVETNGQREAKEEALEDLRHRIEFVLDYTKGRHLS